MSELLSSYSSANVFPAKILHHEKLMHSCLHNHKVFPIHLQLNPTNRCNFNCKFCSCSSRDKMLELSVDDVCEIMYKAKRLGCESCTITGGGEPLMHKHLDDLFGVMEDEKIEVGLVTNGLLLNRIEEYSQSIVWCRISCSDELPSQLERIGKITSDWFQTIENAQKENPHIDWAFSYVLTGKTNKKFIQQLVEFANNHYFTHIRLVCDILHSHKVAPEMYGVTDFLRQVAQVDDSKVIYQTRANWTHGQNPCYISLLKPVVGADSYVYPCCGTQYALANPSRDYEKSMRMGYATDLDKLVEEQAFFDGSVCVRCYYSNYNWALKTLLGTVKHEKFV